MDVPAKPVPPFSPRLLCTLIQFSAARPIPLSGHPTPTLQRCPPAHGDQVPTLHGHIAGRCFLGGQPQSHGGLDKARFHPDMRPLLPPPAAPHPARRPGPLTGSRLGPLPAGAPRPLHGHCPAAESRAQPPGSLPRWRHRSKTRPGRELSEVLSRGPSPPPPLAACPPRPVTSGPSGPAHRQAGDQSAEGADLQGEGRGPGPKGGRRGSPKEAAIRRSKREHLACPPPPHSEPRTPCFTSELRHLYSRFGLRSVVFISDFYP